MPANSTYKGEVLKTTQYRLVELKQFKERVVEGRFIGKEYRPDYLYLNS